VSLHSLNTLVCVVHWLGVCQSTVSQPILCAKIGGGGVAATAENGCEGSKMCCWCYPGSTSMTSCCGANTLGVSYFAEYHFRSPYSESCYCSAHVRVATRCHCLGCMNSFISYEL
jgi:hypothetical protein